MRRWLLSILMVPIIIIWAIAAQALTITGLVLDHTGKGIAGAIFSDEINAVASDTDGGFSLDTKPGRVVSITAPAGYAVPNDWWWPVEKVAGQKLRIRLSAVQSSNEPLVALISDPHLFDEKSGPLQYPVPPHVAKRPVATWARVAKDIAGLAPTLTIVTGDLCVDADKGGEAHAKAQFAIAANAMALLPSPARALPGNHDLRYTNGKVDQSLWRQTFGPTRQVFLVPGAAFILMDNVGLSKSIHGKPRACGYLPDEAFSWFGRILDLIPGQYDLYLVGHYPPATPMAGANPLHKRSLVESLQGKGLALTDADQSFGRVAHRLSDRKLIAFIHGHEHAGHSTVIQARKPFQVIGLPALCGGWWQGDREWNGNHFAPAYALMRLKRTPQGTKPQLKIIEVKY